MCVCVCDCVPTWYSVLSVCVTVAACCSGVCVRGLEDVWSRRRRVSLGVEMEHSGSTAARLLTSKTKETLEPRLDTVGEKKAMHYDRLRCSRAASHSE